jgi:hypothetical protein
MFKRLLLISLVCIGLIALVGTEATARCRVVSGKLRCTDVCADTFLKGVGNPEIKPVYVCAVLYIDKVKGQCWNKPYNATKTKGTVFFPLLSLPAGTFVKLVDVDDKGWAEVEVCWTDVCPDEGEPGYDPDCSGWDVILSLVQAEINEITGCTSDLSECPDEGETDGYAYCPGGGICVNPNWWFDQCNWTIEVVYVYHVSYQYAQDGETLISVSPLCRRCKRDPYTPEECKFDCSDAKLSECESRGLHTECWSLVNSQ